ncbi:ABC transporter ATP-binding protein [Pseudobacteroides cellulosolvens]|uniref:Sulfate-transporting ATPase n=1 Tax=Pseudobacteroides cellulosolvens ATCC 35603 = DSM 2933 TaxID=398512 RepID=A0A0L6JU42_9FIRM|nr:ABC transporter ATP-binding protein [Pseudobacteroides cellulosolvens]KNY28947.1 Sulfate-transporting ATPase [Pseudobacteroides cellulosolvens ATCC 35603 = DSM 2933]
MSKVLQVINIYKEYGTKENRTQAINGISFEVEEGEFLGIMGPSGSGKSTLLNCISTIDTISAGQIKINDRDITTLKNQEVAAFRRENLGFIFQNFNLLDTLTAYENIALALSIMKSPVSEMEAKILKVAKTLGIEEVLQKYPYQMSGGQQQRVSAARAIVCNPSLVLADEPTGALDSRSAKMLLNNLETMNDDMKATILMVTHDSNTASYCKRILFIKDGKIYKELLRGSDDRKVFFDKIMDVVAAIGGE